MCGIVAYYGPKPVENIINGLKNVSYRGYDSWGFFLANGSKVYHYLGSDFDAVSPNSYQDEPQLCIGHTRWATHGKISYSNCQPIAGDGIALVHNGMVNLPELFYADKTQSDTRVLFDFINGLYKAGAKDETIVNVLTHTEGDNAFLLYLRGRLYAVLTGNKELYEGGNVISSDINNIPDGCLWHTLTSDRPYHAVRLDTEHAKPITLAVKECDNMLNEIYSQAEMKTTQSILTPSNAILFGCGSSYNAALYHAYKHGYKAMYATEVPLLPKNPYDTFVAISQSGETKDVLDTVDFLLENQYKVVGFTNNSKSTLARRVDCEYMKVGPEYGVAATKSFLSTILHFSSQSNIIKTDVDSLNTALLTIPLFDNYIFLGEAEYYPLALEGELKLKEVAQVWTDAMYASEIKHGPIACVSDKTLVIILASRLTSSLLSNVAQVKARGAKVLGFLYSDEFDYVAGGGGHSTIVNSIIGCQLLAYHAACKRGLNPDKPKNLAKSVTV